MGNCVHVPKSSQQLNFSINTKAQSGLVGSHFKVDAIRDGNVGLHEIYESQLSSHVVSSRASNGAEEIYFDSIPWMESDSEDFYSVNGDFTPSRGNSPIHQSSSIHSAQRGKASETVVANTVSECSPNGKKKLLIELFRESFNNAVEFKSSPIPFSHISFDKSPYEHSDNCSESSRAILQSDTSYVTVKSRSKPCCIPVIARNLSFSETKKKLCFSDTGGG